MAKNIQKFSFVMIWNKNNIIPTRMPAHKANKELLMPKIGSMIISKNKKFSPSPNKIVGKYKERWIVIFPYSDNKAMVNTTNNMKNKTYSKKKLMINIFFTHYYHLYVEIGRMLTKIVF